MISDINVLVIDDEDKFRQLLSRIISLEGFTVIQASSLNQGLKMANSDKAIDIVLTDVKLPDGNGIELVEQLKKIRPDCEVIVMTAYGTIQDGVKAMKSGAFDYLVKGDENEKIIPVLHKAIESIDLKKRIINLEKQLKKKYEFDSILGKSKVIQQAVELAKKVAKTDTTVLLTGETGTGKEVFAQTIHRESDRSNKNFVAINCSAFAKELLESEMFGHKAGAFTGAVKDQKGLFEEANNGTIFLDEVGEMAIDLQAKLLRIIETGEFYRVGETKPTKVNVRIIAATNRDLQKEIEAGNFRMDLYYRISVFQINLPSLRERVVDIEPLARHFAEVFAVKTNKRIKSISDEFLECLKRHRWQGNIRELKNVIERAVILTNSDELDVDCLSTEFQTFNQNNSKQLSAFDLASAEKLHIQKVINYTNGNKTEAARLLNIALTTLYRKLEEYKIGHPTLSK